MSGEMCRLCLTSDTRRLNIINTVLQDIYEKIADVKLSYALVCYICYGRLRQCYSLMRQAVATEKLLKEAVTNGIQLKDLLKTKQCGLHTSSVISISLEPSPVTEIKHEERGNCLKAEEIKNEPDPEMEHGVTPLCASVAISNDSEEHSTEAADAGPSSEQATTIVSGDLDCRSADSDSRTNDNIDRYTNCIVKLYDVFGEKVVPKQDASLTKTRKVFISCDSKKDFNNISYESKSQNDVVPKQDASLTVTRKVFISCDSQKDFNNMRYESKSQNKVPTTKYIEPATDEEQVNKPRKSLLVKHIQSHETVNRFTCEICGFKFKYMCSLTRHLRTHTGEKPFMCRLCDFKTAHKISLSDHMRNHTGEKPYSCKLCEYKTAYKSNLIIHTKNHTGEKPFSCKLCEYKAAHKRRLVVHMRNHTGEKPYSCKLCEFKTVHNGHLVVHMRLHTGEKPYSCKLCEYKATRKSHLVVHMRNHTGEKPYSCELCEFKTARSDYLVDHMRNHTREKPYSCKFCEYKGARKRDLGVHMKKHTGEKPLGSVSPLADKVPDSLSTTNLKDSV